MIHFPILTPCNMHVFLNTIVMTFFNTLTMVRLGPMIMKHFLHVKDNVNCQFEQKM